jgi:phosphoglycolate phosphatase
MLSASPAASQLAIFDFDGTIADSLGDVLAMYNVVARQRGFSTVSDEQVPHLRTLGPREVAKELRVPIWRIPQLTGAVRKAMLTRMEDLKPFEGMVEMLHELWQRGTRTAIVSSNAYENVSKFLAERGALEAQRPDYLVHGPDELLSVLAPV